MVKILLIHNSKHSNPTFVNKLKAKYPILGLYPKIWKITVVHPQKKIQQKARRNFDRIYYDEESVTLPEILEYIAIAGNPQIFPVNLKPRKKGKKNRLNITRKITKLKESGDE